MSESVGFQTHSVEIEATGHKPPYWADCSCGWFHGAKNRDDAKKLKAWHMDEPNAPELWGAPNKELP